MTSSNTSPAPVVVVTGANGLVGSHIVAALSERQATVLAVVRRAGTAPSLPGVEERVGDFADPAFAADVVAGADALVTTVHPLGGDGESQRRVGLDGTLAIARAAAGAGVERVVFAVDDPGHHSGGGAERLRDGGVTVVGGVLAGPAEDLLGDWLTTARLGRPLVTVKWASSLDGRIAASDGTSRWITGDAARDDVHRRRAAHDAAVQALPDVEHEAEVADPGTGRDLVRVRGGAGDRRVEQRLRVVGQVADEVAEAAVVPRQLIQSVSIETRAAGLGPPFLFVE